MVITRICPEYYIGAVKNAYKITILCAKNKICAYVSA